MKKHKITLMMAVGWSLFAITRIILLSIDDCGVLHALSGFAVGLILTGSLLQVLSHHGVSEKLKQWKEHRTR